MSTIATTIRETRSTRSTRETAPATAPRRRREVLRPAGRATQPGTPLARTAPRERHLWLLEPLPTPTRTAPAPRPVRPEPATVPSTPGAVRLTRRGRVVAGVAAVAAAVTLGLGLTTAVGPEPAPNETTRMHVVQPGETLWAIAQGTSVDAPVGEVVDRIEELNDLDTALLEPGQRLRVPTAS